MCAKLGRARIKSSANNSIQWIGFREFLQEKPIFNGKIYGFWLRFPLNQSIDPCN
jgi:hypothetical protein